MKQLLSTIGATLSVAIVPVASAHPSALPADVTDPSFLLVFGLGIVVGIGVGVALAVMWMRKECPEETE